MNKISFLSYIPGFRSNKLYKKIIASIYYIFSLLALISQIQVSLFLLSIPFFIFYLSDSILYKKKNLSLKRAIIPVILSFIIMISSMATMPKSSNDKQVGNIDSQKQEKIIDKEKKEQERLAKEQREKDIAEKFVQATVTNVVDGNSIDVKLADESTHRVKLIGINTPQTSHPSKGTEFYGKEAYDYIKESLLSKTVYLEKDANDKDEHGNFLRYIWLEVPFEASDINTDINSINNNKVRYKLFNADLALNGYASVDTLSKNIKYIENFREFEQEAKNKNIGLWNQEAKSSYEANLKAASNKATQSQSVSSNKGNSSSNNTSSKSSSNSNDTSSNNTSSSSYSKSNSGNKTSNSSSTQAQVNKPQQPAPNQNQGSGVFITKTGKKYHAGWCGSLSRSKIAISLSDAKARGYGACEKCNPPG